MVSTYTLEHGRRSWARHSMAGKWRAARDPAVADAIVGESAALKSVLQEVSLVAPTDATVLILGETGTGKELIARAIHNQSNRSARPFIRVNCAAIPASLIASELFGHERGAFTGALQRRLGRFEAANGGTIFLDEIGELPMETQITLLRVIQEREFERVGSSQPISVDVRIIAATNRDLQGRGERGHVPPGHVLSAECFSDPGAFACGIGSRIFRCWWSISSSAMRENAGKTIQRNPNGHDRNTSGLRLAREHPRTAECRSKGR